MPPFPPGTQSHGHAPGAGAPPSRVRIPWRLWVLTALLGAAAGTLVMRHLDAPEPGPRRLPPPMVSDHGPRRILLSRSSRPSPSTRITARALSAETSAPAPEAAGVLLHVRVIESGGRSPVPEALVHLRPPAGEPLELATGPDGIGEIRVPVWPLRSITVAAEAPGFSPAPASEKALPEGAREAELTIELSAPTRLSGCVVEAGSRTPLSGAWIRVTSEDPILSEAGWEETQTDARGFYELVLELLPAGDLTIQAESPGCIPGLRQHVKDTGRVIRQDFELEREAAIRGRVVDASGAGIAGASVSVVASRPELADVGSGTITGGDGRFELEFSGIPRTAAWILASAEDCSPAAVGVPAPGGEAVIRLGPVAHLRGKIRVPGEPVRADPYTVRAVPRDLYGSSVGEDTALSESDGSYDLECRSVPPDHADLVVESDSGRSRGARPLPPDAGVGREPIDVTVAVPFTMRGRVTAGAEGTPVTGALVRIASRDPRYAGLSSFTTTDGDGRYTLDVEGVPRESLEVWVEDGEAMFGTGEFDAEEDETILERDLQIGR